jgi:ADP-heptose:LPS heptosyltransferase
MNKVVVSRTVETSQDKPLTLREFYNARDTILILRAIGGLGDILMHRMLFEDIKLLMPDSNIHFACPTEYHDAVRDHPYIDVVIDSLNIDKHNYVISYNTSTACGRYELKIAPLSDLHRADIWAAHCGFTLTKHNMHIKISEEEKVWARKRIAEVRDRNGLVVLVSPISAMAHKDLSRSQQEELVKGMWDRGLCPIGLHTSTIVEMIHIDVPQINRIKVREWMALISECDAVLSVDTSTFHCAGGMGKPVVGVFSFAPGQTYSKYYPNAELVQGPCPAGFQGCYDWCACPFKKEETLPCLTGITGDMLLNGIDTMLNRFFRREDATENCSK